MRFPQVHSKVETLQSLLEITCPLNTLGIFDVFLITPQRFLARLNLLINLLELTRYSNPLHTYSGVQVDGACTGFVFACSTFLIEHLETARLHRGSVKAKIFPKDNTERQHSRFSCQDLSISIVEFLLFLPSGQIFWVGKTSDRLIERMQSASVEQSAEDMIGEESGSSCALPR